MMIQQDFGSIYNNDYLPRSEAAVLGAKNLMPLNYYSGKSKTENNATYTVNDDGSITIVISATMTVTSVFYLIDYTRADYINIPSFYISGGNDLSSDISIVYSDRIQSSDSWGNSATCDSSDSKLVIPRIGTTQQTLFIRINSGATAGTYRVYPMIRLGSDPDSSYAPPALTNRELSIINDGTFTANTTNITLNSSMVKQQGHIVVFKIIYKPNASHSAGSNYTVGTILPLPSETMYYLAISSGVAGLVTISSAGTITFAPLGSAVATTSNIIIDGTYCTS